MKLKSLKKQIKQHLFNYNVSTNSYMVFEIKTEKTINLISPSILINSFSKQICSQLKYTAFDKIKFPTVIKSSNFLKDFLIYFLALKEKKMLSNIFLIKINFILIKKDMFVLSKIFLNFKNISLFNFLLCSLLKKKGCVFFHKLFYPFIVV